MNKAYPVIIFGASSGYGAGIAARLKAAGFTVIGCSRSYAEHADIWHDCDVTKPHEIAAVAKQYPIVSAVVYSAGIAIEKTPVAYKENDVDWQRVFDVNTLGILHVAREFYMALKTGAGTFIHIGSIANRIQYPGGVDYCASKAAASSILRGLRLEWLGLPIRVTSIEPGLGNTNFQYNRYSGNIEKAVLHTQGIKQLEPADLARVVEFILELPGHVNIDTIEVKPLDQADHGKLSTNAQTQF